MDEDDARVSRDDRRLLVADLGELSEGSYTVEWRIASADGHPIDGEYEFAMNASAAGTLVLSTSTRLGRVVDRVRTLAEMAEELHPADGTPGEEVEEKRKLGRRIGTDLWRVARLHFGRSGAGNAALAQKSGVRPGRNEAA